MRPRKVRQGEHSHVLLHLLGPLLVEEVRQGGGHVQVLGPVLRALPPFSRERCGPEERQSITREADALTCGLVSPFEDGKVGGRPSRYLLLQAERALLTLREGFLGVGLDEDLRAERSVGIVNLLSEPELRSDDVFCMKQPESFRFCFFAVFSRL